MSDPPPVERSPWFFAFARFLCRAVCAIMFRPRVFGRENVPREGGVLLASNHQSFLDPVLVGIRLPRHTHFMARETLFRSWLAGWVLPRVNAFPIRRGEADKSAIREAIRRVSAGAALVVFPEGTRTRDGSLGRIRPGIFVIAERAGVPIVPVVIDGAFRAWPRHAKLPRPHRVQVVYGEPIPPGADDPAALVTERLTAMQAKLNASKD